MIVRSTIDLAHNLGLTVVAEGVETAAILERLRRLAVRRGAGLPHQRGPCRWTISGLAGPPGLRATPARNHWPRAW
jgi:EAL domain-containing protein (putative c-di-GMP-specific phosphodiesterase class I)